MSSSPRGSYLGSQIRGENYNAWGPDIAGVYTVTGTEVWTPTTNPVGAASGVSAPVISMKGIVIPAGASLTIQNMTVKMAGNTYVDVRAGTSSIGGRLILDNAILTASVGGCENTTWSMWGGVRVFGNPSQPQWGITTSMQGYVKMTNNSEISYAKTGVFVGQLAVSYSPYGFGLTTGAYVGGGVIVAENSLFRNNNTGVSFQAYNNFNPSTSAIINNTSYFNRCKFTSDNLYSIPSGTLIHIHGVGVKGIRVRGCEFENFTGVLYPTYGIHGINMGITVDHYTVPPMLPSSILFPSKFTNFMTAIYHSSTLAGYTAAVRSSEFIRNKISVSIYSTFAPVVADNTFNINNSPYTPPIELLTGHTQSIGLALFTSSSYTVSRNTFRYASASGIRPALTTGETIGTLAWSTGGTDNLIHSNTYKGLGVANLANFDNRYGSTGLWYKCNSHSDNWIDIAARGFDNGGADLNKGHGIRIYQGFPYGSSGAGHASGLPAGNTFSGSNNTFNLYNKMSECKPFTYYHPSSSFGGVPLDEPGVTGVTGLIHDASVNKTMLNAYKRCSSPGYFHDQITNTTHVAAGGRAPIPVDPVWTADELQIAVASNINYYMNDEAGVEHRDSLYYWVNEVKTPQSGMALATMLLQDSLIDSAYAIYDAIATNNSMSEEDSLGFAYWGKKLFMAQIVDAIKSGCQTNTFAALAADIDTLSDSTIFSRNILDIIDVLNGANGWARIKAEIMLRAYNRVLYDSLLLQAPDTVLYPTQPDSIFQQPSPKGVLAVTELSLGAEEGCQYAELVVANCGTDASSYVDIRGWVINDNSGIFSVTDPQQNPNGDCAEDVGITPGHFRLPYDDIWENVPVGSFLVLYNHDVNCYNLPDSFTLDSFNSIYYIPVGVAINGNHLEQYMGTENSNECSYCSDTGTTVFSDSTAWMTTIGFDDAWDGLQVLCPGCSPDHNTAPAFYHGLGYRSGTATNGTLKQAAVLENNGGAGYKYIFTGTTAAHLSQHSSWTTTTADPLVGIPVTIGKVNPTFYTTITEHELDMPCCGQEQGGKPGNGKGKDIVGNTPSQTIRAYPNPATMMLYFEFPASGEVTISITDIAGRVMDKRVVSNAGKAGFNVKGYTPGIYVYQVITNGKTQTGKVMIGD